jgi:zinc protease
MAISFRLDNGLTVVFEAQHAAKVAAFQVWVKAGSADERPDQAGLAHLHEHMLFKGTLTRGPGELARRIEGLGGEINAWTSFDQTVYHVVMASAFAEEGLTLLADAVRNPAFNPVELEREIEVVCEEIKRSDDTPSRRASRQLFETAFVAHPYARPVIGWESTVRGFTREKVLEFYTRHYTPENLVLAASGDVALEDVKRWAQATLGGDWGRRFAGPVTRPVEPAPTSLRVSVREDDVKEAYLSLAFPAPPAEHEDAPALDVLAMLVGQGDASRLSLEVKRRRSLVSAIHAYAYTPKDAGLFVMSFTGQSEHLEQALEEGTHTLLQARSLVTPDDELETVKAVLEAEAIYQRETIQGTARKLGFYQSTFGDLAAEARYYEAIAAVTPKKLLEVAQRYLDPAKATLTALVPKGQGAPGEAQLREALARGTTRAPGELPARVRPPRAPVPAASITRSNGRPGDLVVQRLSNGAQLVIREEPTVPLFAMRAAFFGGVRFETEKDNGLNTLLCRTLTRGTKTHDAEALSTAVDEMAGSLSAGTGRSSVTLRGEFLSKHFARAFDLFAECLTSPTFPEAELDREKKLLLQDIHTKDDKPAGLAFELFSKTLYRSHPYRLPVMGEADSVGALDRAALEAFRVKHLTAKGLVLCVVGDVRIDDVLQRAESALSALPKEAPASPVLPQEPAWTGPRSAHRKLERAQSHLVLGFPGLTVRDPDRYALEVLSTVLSGQGGRLFIELRDKRSMAYSVSSYAVEGVEPGYFAVYMGTSPSKLDAALEGIRAELTRVRDEPISKEELERAIQHLVGTHEIGLQRNGARASLLALDYLFGLGDEGFSRYAKAIASVTAEKVQAVARKVIDFDRSALATVGP